jgi:hypothetical protein
MKFMRKTLPLAMLALLVALLGAGCGGISGSGSVSPIDFLMPGIIKNDRPPAKPAPVDTLPAPEATATVQVATVP